MAKELKLRRGTTSQHSTFTGAAGEVTVDTDKNTAIVHDGSTAGGYPLAKVTDIADATNVAGADGTSGQVLQSDGDGTMSWASISGGFFTQQVTFSTDTTITSANAGKVYYTSTSNLVLTLPAPPGGTDVLAYGIINDSATDLILSTNTPASESIGPHLGSAIIASKEEGIIVSVGSNWKFIGTNATAAINLVHFDASGTYTPEPTVSSFLVCLGGASGSTDGDVFTSEGSWGGSYGEKLYTSPTGSYSVTIGAGGAAANGARNSGTSSNFNSQLVVNGSSHAAAGTVTGADYSAAGGADGGGTRPGGGGGAGRAGIGGNGASNGGGGGGTGGNNASGTTGGAAATSENGSVYNLAALIGSFTFEAGGNGNGSNQGGMGAWGRQNIVDLSGNSDTIRGGARGIQSNFAPIAGANAACTIIEFKG